MDKMVIMKRLCDQGMERLEGKVCYTVVDYDDAAECGEVLKDAGALLVKMARVGADAIAAGAKLKVIGRHGVGFDSVDVGAATKRGIPVVITPGANRRSVAEHTLAMILALCKNLVESDREMKAGNWEVRHFNKSFEFEGKTIGFLGLGNIGGELAAMCRGIGFNIMAYDPFVPNERMEKLGYTPCHNTDVLLQSCDILSVHVPLNEETRGMIGWRELNLMKPTALLVNCARGGIVDEDALARSLRERVIAGAGLDVFVGEVPQPDGGLLTAPNLICTPHMAANTEKAERQICDQMISGVLAVLEGKKWPHVADRRVYDHPVWKDRPWA